MTQENVRICLNKLNSKIPTEYYNDFRKKLEELPDEAGQKLASLDYQEPIVVLLLSIFAGSWGIDRFVLGDVSLGICKLLFNWLTCGIWWLVDIFFSFKRAKTLNYEKIQQVFAEYSNYSTRK